MDLRGHVAAFAHEHNIPYTTLERLADEVGVPVGERADDRQLSAILARLHGWAIDTPSAAARAAAATPGASSGLLPAPPPAAPSPDLQARIERARAKGQPKPDDEDKTEQLRAGMGA